MTTREKIIEGLKIAEQAEPEGHVWAGHDVFSLGADLDLTDEQKQALKALGFRNDDDYGWFCYT